MIDSNLILETNSINSNVIQNYENNEGSNSYEENCLLKNTKEVYIEDSHDEIITKKIQKRKNIGQETIEGTLKFIRNLNEDFIRFNHIYDKKNFSLKENVNKLIILNTQIQQMQSTSSSPHILVNDSNILKEKYYQFQTKADDTLNITNKEIKTANIVLIDNEIIELTEIGNEIEQAEIDNEIEQAEILNEELQNSTCKNFHLYFEIYNICNFSFLKQSMQL